MFPPVPSRLRWGLWRYPTAAVVRTIRLKRRVISEIATSVGNTVIPGGPKKPPAPVARSSARSPLRMKHR